MTDVTLGGETISLPPMNFAALKTAWPSIQRLGQAADPIERMSAGIAVLAAAAARLRPELTAAEIETRAAVSELSGLMQALPKLLAESGFAQTAEGPAAGEPSPATSTP